MNYPNAYVGSLKCGCVISLVADAINDKEGTEIRVNRMKDSGLTIFHETSEKAMKLLCHINYLNQIIHRCKK